MRKKRHYGYSFAARQKAMLAALLIVTLLDFAVSAVSVERIGRETTEQMRKLAVLHTSQVYEECDRIGYDMRRLLMENTDMTSLAEHGTDRERIYAKGNLMDRISYSFGNQEEYHPFFYFEGTQEVLGSSWLKIQEAKEQGIIDRIVSEIEAEEDLEVDFQRWIPFSFEDAFYMLRAYRYNGVWVICYVPAERLISSLEQVYQGEENQVLLLDSAGNILSGKEKIEGWRLDNRMLLEGGTYYRFPFERIQIVRECSEKLDVSVAVVMRGYGGFSRIILLQAVVLFMVLLTLGAFLVMTVYTKKRIIAPVQKFVKGLLDYADHDAHREELSVSDIHELEQINEQFRRFVHQIGALKIDIYEEKLRRQKLEMDNMKLQLKPHFFLNSLNLIYRFLQVGRVEDAQKMCMATIRYLRYLFSAGMDEVQVSEAIGHVEDYFEIMKLRYPGEVEVDLYVEEEAENCVLPPLMIQTLVENSFKYGKLAGKKLEISVTVEVLPESGSLCINVSDNGRGYPEEYVEIWAQGKELDQADGTHIGIANIRARLQYAYGSHAGMQLYNSPMGGAAAEIRIPMKNRNAETETGS